VRPLVVQITDALVLPEAALFARLEALGPLPAPVRARFAVQLRDPGLTGRALLDLGARLRSATRALGVGLVVNDRLDLALALGADGVHLGRRSMAVADARALLLPGVWISVACHGVDEVVQAAEDRADAVLLSPIFPSPGKGMPLGPAALSAAGAALAERGLSIQLVALGGVDTLGAPSCFAAGADGVAAIRADLRGILEAEARRSAGSAS
jgi:thiamine-phosphate pyrophosphorylase